MIMSSKKKKKKTTRKKKKQKPSPCRQMLTAWTSSGMENQKVSMFVLNLWFRFEVINQGFIFSYKTAVEILRVSLEASQKCLRNINVFQLMLWRQHLWDPSYWQLAQAKISVKTVWSKSDLSFVDTLWLLSPLFLSLFRFFSDLLHLYEPHEPWNWDRNRN